MVLVIKKIGFVMRYICYVVVVEIECECVFLIIFVVGYCLCICCVVIVGFDWVDVFVKDVFVELVGGGVVVYL